MKNHLLSLILIGGSVSLYGMETDNNQNDAEIQQPTRALVARHLYLIKNDYVMPHSNPNAIQSLPIIASELSQVPFQCLSSLDKEGQKNALIYRGAVLHYAQTGQFILKEEFGDDGFYSIYRMLQNCLEYCE